MGNNKKHKISFIALLILTFCVFLLTGCFGKADKNGSMKAEDGRKYGGLIEGKEGQVISTAFFDMTIEDSLKYETFQFNDGLYKPEAGETYLVVTLTIKNTYQKDLPMSITDFVLGYEGSEEQKITGYGKTDLNLDDYMENLFTLKTGESITKKILFTVPDKEVYTVTYKEFYEDKFEGNKFVVSIDPQKMISGENTEEAVTED